MRLNKLPFAFVACSSLLAASACTRTSDGSVVMSTSAMPSLFARGPDRQSFGPDQRSVALAELPPAPRTVAPRRPERARVAPTLRNWKVPTVKAPFERADPQKPLNCRNETAADGRVRVVCT